MKKFLIILLVTLMPGLMLANAMVDSNASSNTTGHLANTTFPKPDSSDAYLNYLYEMGKKYGVNYPEETYVIKGSDYVAAKTTAEVEIVDKDSNAVYENANNEDLLIAPETGKVSFETSILSSGFYNIVVRYFPVEGRSSSIERSFSINDEVPFPGNDALVFSRIWSNSEEIKQDVNGNDVKPTQKENPEFREDFFKDAMGYTTEAYKYYFAKNESGEKTTFSLSAIKEPMLIDEIRIVPVVENISYEEYKAEVAGKTNNASGQFGRTEGEAASAKSSPTLSPQTDRTSTQTYPYSAKEVKLNTIGGTSWKLIGDWITWDVEVPADGYYNISLRAKQSLVRGMYSSRKVMIDGETLFDELNDVKFSYDRNWQNVTLGNGEENYEFYLEKGTHTITMEVTLGKYGPLIQRIQDVIDNLNSLYRDIISFTTVSPDPNRDYDLHLREDLKLIDRLTVAAKELRAISKEIETISGETSDKTGVLDSVAYQIEDFIDDPRSIPSRLGTFSNNVSSLGTILTSLRELPLEVDYVMIHAADVELPRENDNFFEKIKKFFVDFWYSFFIDYNAIGSTVDSESESSIEVWMTLGKDQANVIRQIIDETFTPNTGIKVDLKLTGADVLLKSTLAGIGPDVALNVDSTLPVNYALRNAVLDLREFDDYETVSEQFNDSANRQFQFNGGAYALPEKEIFLMMFVRDDLLEEYGLSDMVPDTWDEVISLVAELQARQLQFFLPVNDLGAVSLNPIFVSLLYQYGGELYANDNKETGLLSDEAMRAFEYWTEFYTLYSFPKSANFVNRFRSGEMPIGIAYYEAYNTLSVFAPELRGKWSFYPIPGTEKIDEETGTTYIDRTATSSGTGCVILKQPALKSEQVKEDSWEFMKWWTSTDTQVRFGREMEGILGSAARHATANKAALQQLAWPQSELEQLMFQWDQVHEMPQIAGSYITGREVENAYRVVINDMVNARETLYEYAQKINNEIDRKRKEFGLPLRGE